jgi:hypothetical protein
VSLGATLSGSLQAVLDRPSTWPLALAGFLIRGGWLLVVAPIVVLPTAVGLANVVAPLLEDIAFGRRLSELVVLIVVALVVVVGWLIGGGLFAALAELEVVRRIAPSSGEGQASPVEAADPWTAAWRIVAVRLAAHVPFATVLVWGATRIASVGYAELTVPSDVTVPAPWRIATGAPDAIVGIVLTWLLGEAIGAMGARRVALRGEAARPALRAAIARFARSPVRPSLLALLPTIVLVGVIVLTGIAAGTALDAVRSGFALDDASAGTTALLVVFVALFGGGIMLLALTTAWRAAIWTFDAAAQGSGTFGGGGSTRTGD